MKNNYTVVFIMLSVVSIFGGLALNSVFEYAPLFGFGLGIIFIICSAYFAFKNAKN